MHKGLWLLASAALLTALGTVGCNGDVECKSEITQGSGTYAGVGKGKKDDPNVRKDSIKDACRQMCADTKATLVEPCAAKCSADVEGGKIGLKTDCPE